MLPLYKIYFRDIIRFLFFRIKKKSLKDIGIYKFNAFSIKDRIEALEILKERFSVEEINQLSSSKRESISWYDEETIYTYFDFFNKRKFVNPKLDKHDLIINQAFYCEISSVFLNHYIKTKNIQLLNSSLKINDHLLYTQIKQKGKYYGYVSTLFPSYHNKKGLIIEKDVNYMFYENLKLELEIINWLKT